MFALLTLVYTVVAHATEPDVKDTLQAAISYNLARFVTRTDQQATTAAPLIFCIHQENPIAEALELMQTAKSGSQTVQLRKISSYDRFYAGCDISFVAAEDLAALSMAQLAKSGNITIGETQGFLDIGGAVQLIQTGQKFSFLVNLTAFATARKTLSSRVLMLAREVRLAP